MAIAYLGLGSNLGDRLANLKKGLRLLTHKGQITKNSTVYETMPFDVVGDQPDFLNMVAEYETYLTVRELFVWLKEIEAAIGRKPDTSHLPRELDIDLLLYDDLVLNDTAVNLSLPHKDMANRAFVLKPLAEIAPNLVHPLGGVTLKKMARAVEADGIRKFAKI